jgi:hypothetical protein
MNSLVNEEGNIVYLDEDMDKTFLLKSPPKGKIYKGPNWNAFIKKNFGSIPKNSENILSKEKFQEMKIGFSSQTRRFKNNSEDEKFSFPGPGKYKEINLQEKGLKNPSFSNKGYGGFLSTTDRFDILRKFYEKNLVEEGKENKKDELLLENKSKNSKMFKSIYNFDELKSIKKLKQSTVSNFYNPLSSINLDIQKNNNLTKENFYFQSRNRQRLPIENTTLSPGVERCFMNNTNTFNNQKIYNKTSCFFNNNSEKVMEIANKYLHQKKFPIKFGQQGNIDIKNNSGKLRYDNNNNNKRKIIFYEYREKDILKEKELEENGIKKEAFMPFISPFKKLKNSSGNIYLSKIQK